MYRVEIWIDVVCDEEGRGETICTLFSSAEVPMRPCVGESLSFCQAEGSALEFKLASSAGVSRQSSITVVVEDVRHYAVESDGSVRFSTALRCTEIIVASKNEAHEIVAFLTTQLGFELDPYGVNKLGL